MKTLSKVLLCFLTILVSAHYAHGEQLLQSQVIKAEGVGAIVNNDKAIARDNAIEDALRKAVEQAVGTLVSSETMVENFQLLSDRIYTKTEGYVQQYKIISEAPAENIYKVTLEATVTLGNLKNDLAAIGLLMARKHKPRVMVLIAEQNIGQQYLSFWWGHQASETNLSITESVLVEKFREKDFNVVDHAAKARDIKIGKPYKVANLDDNTAVSLGNQYDAEVVIVGKALAKLVGSVMGTSMKSAQANMSARAIRTDNGAIIASANTHGAAVHIDEVTGGSNALKKAASDLASKLIDQIITTWGKEISGTTMVQLTINGISSYHDFMKFKNVLQEQVRGVKGVYQRSINAGVAKIDIDIKGDSQSLADELTTKNFQNFSININSLSQNSLDLTILPKNR
ncbi:MAG: flagellar assembly protein T N-terminal domain-containing protein [Thermodesulfobacteriota bacterium]